MIANIIRRWSVLDLRTNPAEVYEYVVIHRADNTAFIAKAEGGLRKEKFQIKTVFDHPEMKVFDVCVEAQRLIDMLEQKSCAAISIPTAQGLGEKNDF